MSTGQNKRHLAPEYILEENTHSRRDVATSTNELVKESCEEETVEMVQSPVFNIHIHVPANDSNTTKMYLPRIQPIIHLHFDELAKKLANISQLQKGGLSQTHLQNLVSQLTPKFGDVLFHYKDNSFNRDVAENKINISPLEQSLRDKNSSIDLETSRSDVTEIMRNHISEVIEQSSNNHHKEKTNRNSEEISNLVLTNDHTIKLKKAVVVLDDICRLKSYKGAAVSNLVKENKVVNNSSGSASDKLWNSGLEIKKNHASSFPPHTYCSTDSSEKTNLSDNYLLNPFSGTQCSESVHCDFKQTESLESLLKGCNFSEILRRFREKQEKCIDDSLGKSNCLVKTNSMVESDKGLVDKTVTLTQNNIQTQNEEFSVYQTHVKEEEQEEGQNKDGTNFQEENCVHGIESYKTNIQSCPKNKNLIGHGIDTSELNSSNSYAVQEFIKTAGMITKDNEIVCSVNEFQVADAKSDNIEIATRNKLNSDIIKDLRTIEFDLSNNTSNVVIKNEYDLLDTNELFLVDKEGQNFDFKLMAKELTMTKQGVEKIKKHEKRKLRDAYELRSQSGKEPSPKKTKKTHETPKKSAKESSLQSSSGVKDCVTLDVSGSTRFAVANLAKVPACETHNAKNFKNDMLFGNRVNRFSSSDQLRVYKLKKQVAGRHCDQG